MSTVILRISHVTSYATTQNDKFGVGMWVFVHFFPSLCSAGSSLLLGFMHHSSLCSAGIVDPGLLTLAGIPHISKCSGIS